MGRMRLRLPPAVTIRIHPVTERKNANFAATRTVPAGMRGPYAQKGIPMKIVLLSLAMLGGTTLVSDRVPHLNVEASCKATTAADKAMGLALPQSYEDCMRDENSAQQQLPPVWLAASESVQKQCAGEAVAGGSESYVDLLTCIQMAGYAQSLSPATPLKGASRNRNSKKP